MAKLQIGIIGLGKFGLKFGQSIIELGQTVLGVDGHPGRIKQAQNVLSQVYQVDASSKEALAQLGFGDMNYVLVSVGDSIAASAMITMFLKELGVRQVWVKAINEDHEKLLRKVGADEVIIPEHIAAKQLANKMIDPGFIEYLPFEKDMALKELVVSEWEGKTIRGIDLTNTYNAQILAIKKAGTDSFKFIPKAVDRLSKGDILVVFGNNEELAKVKP